MKDLEIMEMFPFFATGEVDDAGVTADGAERFGFQVQAGIAVCRGLERHLLKRTLISVRTQRSP